MTSGHGLERAQSARPAEDDDDVVVLAGQRSEPDGSGLGPYVSALHASWLATEPERPWREVDGSLVFADVSGFTPLAEKLAKHGKVGAEELTDTLNLVFRSLLDVARGFGGDCLKFGGDALLLLFTGEGHPRAAAAAAHGMLATLHSMRREHRSAGLAKLDMSVGVHTGQVQAFLAGTSHRELLLAGPTVSGVLALESVAEAGEILVSEDVAAHLQGGEVDDTARTGLLLRRAPMVSLVELQTPSVDPGGDTALGVPVAVRGHLDGTRRDGEHRPSVVAFLKFSGTDELVMTRGPAALSDALCTLVEDVQAACALHGVTFLGTDVDRDGGKILLAAGTPAASPDDEDRMLLALRDVFDRDLPVRVRAGVHRGRIFAVDLGSPERRTFTVMGDAVNLAARVMGKAEPGEVVATLEVLNRRNTDFELVALPPFTVKGKSQPVHAQVVGRPRGRLEQEQAPRTPLIGRDEEMAIIRQVLAGAHQGEGGIVELVGEPGIGKSRLVAAVNALDHGLVHFSFEAGRYSLATPYFALRRGMRQAMGLHLDAPAPEVEAALREVVATTAPDLEPWIPLIGIPLGLEIADTPTTANVDAANRKTALESAVVDLMRKVMSSPTLITVEDSHWLDAPSSDLLLALVSGLERRPWAVLVTRRAVVGGLDLPPSPWLRTIALQPLSDEAAVALAGAANAGIDLPPGTIEDLVARSGGNPLFLQELVNAATHGSIEELPDSVEAVVATSIDTLPPRDRSLLRHAAILGGHFPIDVLTKMLSDAADSVRGDVDRLGHFLQTDAMGMVRFRHILLRDVAYEGLPFRARRKLHRRAGTILEESSHDPDQLAELLSIHFDRAGEQKESWHYSCVAGDRAHRNGASLEAAAFYVRALDAARRLDEVSPIAKSDVSEHLGDVWELAGRYDSASEAYVAARRFGHGDPVRRGRLCRKLGLVRDHQGRFATAQRWFSRGIRELEPMAAVPAAQGLRAELTTATVSSQMRQGRSGRSVPLILSAISDAETSNDRAALAKAYCVYDQLLWDQGRYTEANFSERAAAIYEALGNHRGAADALNEKGTTAYWCGRWDQAVADWERAIDQNRLAGGLVNRAINLNNIGEIRSDQGHLAEARDLLEQARVLLVGAGWRDMAAGVVSNLGRVASRAGEDQESARRFDEARQRFIELGAEALLLETEARDAERLVFFDRPQAALAIVRETVPRVEKVGLSFVAIMLDRIAGYAWCQAGEPERGIGHLEASLAACLAAGAEYEAALAYEALARTVMTVGRTDHETFAAEAAAIFERLGVVRTPDVPLPSAPA